MTTNDTDPEWEVRLSELWMRLDELDAAPFRDAMRRLVSELPADSPIALFELGAAYDSTGSPLDAVQLYQTARSAGLTGIRRRRATVQMASSLRNLGRPEEAVALLLEERKQPPDELEQAVAAFLALALADLGREREALAISLRALSAYLPRYNRSLARYADALLDAA